MRLFFALMPDAAAAQRFAVLAGGLSLQPPARAVLRENLHATLAFLGEVRDGELDALRELGRRQQVPRLQLRFELCEYWPSARAIVAVARVVPDELQALAARLRESAARWAMASNAAAKQEFILHVTLARKVAQAPVLPPMFDVSWSASEFSLVRSDTGGTRSLYTVLDNWPLLDDN